LLAVNEVGNEVSYFLLHSLCNIAAEKDQRLFMYVKFIASQRCELFWTWCSL